METAKTVIKATRSGLLAGSAALLVLGTIGFTGTAHARDNVSFSVGIGVPGVAVGVSNNAYPVYSQPVYSQPVYQQQPFYGQTYPIYVQPQPVYVQPAPIYLRPRAVYVQPAPVYVQPAPVYYQNAPVYYGRPHGYGHHGGGYYVPAPRPGYGPGFSGQRYAPVYYQR